MSAFGRTLKQHLVSYREQGCTVVVRKRGRTPFRQIFRSRNGVPANIVGDRWNANTEAFRQITSYSLGWPSISLFSGSNCRPTGDLASKNLFKIFRGWHPSTPSADPLLYPPPAQLHAYATVQLRRFELYVMYKCDFLCVAVTHALSDLCVHYDPCRHVMLRLTRWIDVVLILRRCRRDLLPTRNLHAINSHSWPQRPRWQSYAILSGIV